MTTVRLDSTHSHRSDTLREIRFSLESTVAETKQALERRWGSNPGFMRLQLRDESGAVLAELEDDNQVLGAYGVRDLQVLHVIDTDPNVINLDDSEVKKYEISDEAYGRRNDTFRKFREEQAKKNPNFVKPVKKPIDPEFESQQAAAISLEARCRLNPGDKRGTVRYIGKIPEVAPGWWVGVELDEPLGKNDGSLKGVRYFQCQANYGAFARPSAVEIGDFRPADEDEI
jgi:tubulin-folding cofactor B